MPDLCEVLIVYPDRTPFKANVDTANNWTINAGQMDKLVIAVEIANLRLLALLGDHELTYTPFASAQWAENLLTQLPDSRILYIPGQDDPLPDDDEDNPIAF